MLSIIIILVHVLVTSCPSLLQRFGFTLCMTQFGRLPNCGVQFFCPFEKVDVWGRLYNHQAVVLQPFFLDLDHFTVLVLFSVSWVGTHNKGQLKAMSGHKNIKISMAGFF